MDTITLKPVCADDEALWFRIFADVRAEELGLAAWSPEERAQLLRLQFTAQRRGFEAQFPHADERLILLDGLPVGVLIVDRGGPSLRLVDIAVASEARGLGVGTRVIAALQQEAAVANRPLGLSVLRTNARALALYARLGFRIVGGTDTHHEMEWHCDATEEKPMSDSGATSVKALARDFADPETYRPHVGSTFTVVQDAGPIALRLVKVDDERVSGGFGQFSIFFHGPTDRLLPQGIQTFSHQALGTFEIFIVPVVGSNHERIVYEACFSRQAPTER